MKKEIESKTKPSSMAIIGAIPAQGVIRFIHRIKKRTISYQKK